MTTSLLLDISLGLPVPKAAAQRIAAAVEVKIRDQRWANPSVSYMLNMCRVECRKAEQIELQKQRKAWAGR